MLLGLLNRCTLIYLTARIAALLHAHPNAVTSGFIPTPEYGE